MIKRELTQTRTGIVIGGHYIAPPPRPGEHAVEIQRVLLGERLPLGERIARLFESSKLIRRIIGH